MKKYIRSYRLFLGAIPYKQALIFLVVMAFFGVLFYVKDVLMSDSSDFVTGMFQGMSAMIGPVSTIVGVMQLMTLYNSCSPESPGYKFFRSIPDSGVHFSRAIVAGNVFAGAEGIVMLALVYVIFRLAGFDHSGVLLGALILPFATGICNFAGFMKRNIARVIWIVMVLTVSGFASGFLAGAAEDGEPTLAELFMTDSLPFFIILAAGLILFAVSVILSVRHAREKWGVDKCSD